MVKDIDALWDVVFVIYIYIYICNKYGYLVRLGERWVCNIYEKYVCIICERCNL